MDDWGNTEQDSVFIEHLLCVGACYMPISQMEN